jgi:hypothetical protein
MIGPGIGPAFCGGVPLDVDATAIVAAMTTPPSTAREAAIRAAVAALKVPVGGARPWDLLDTLYVGWSQDAQAGRVDWKLPSRLALPVNAPTHNPNTGHGFDGITQALNLVYVPSVNGVNFTGGQGTLGIWETTDVAASNLYQGGQGTPGANGRSMLAVYRASGIISGSAQTDLGSTGASALVTNRGLTCATVTGLALRGHRNGAVSGADGTVTAAAATDRSLWLGGYNSGLANPSTPRACNVSVAFAGYLNSDARHAAVYAALEAFRVAVGGST